MSPGRLRQALLGGVRFGKPVVLDMADLNVELSYFDPIFDLKITVKGHWISSRKLEEACPGRLRYAQ